MKIAPRFRRWLLIAGALLLLFTVTGFFILPPILKSQIEKRLSAELGRRVTVEKVRLNPYALSLTLENFAISEKDGSASFVGWRRLYVNVEALASLWREWAVHEIALDGFTAKVAINADHSFNFSDLLTKFAPPATPDAASAPAAKSSQPARPVRIASLKVTDARVDFSDASRPQPFATTLGPLTFALTEFRTVSERGAPYRFEAVTEAGEKLAWAGTLQAEPLHSAGELSLENILLPKYAPYYADLIQADLVGGTLSVRGRYEATLADAGRVLKFSDGAVQLRGIKLLERASREPAIELPSLDVRGMQADAVAQKASVDLVNLTGGSVHARREKDGSINLLAMLQPPAGKATPPAPPSSPAPATPTPPTKLPDVTIGEVALKDFNINVTDLAAPRPVQLALGAIQFSLRNVTLAEGAQMPLQLALTLNQQGTVQVAGNIGLSPLKAELKTTVAGLEILPFSPYLETFVNARVTQGSVAATLNADAALTDGQPLAATVTGEVTVEKFGLVDAAHDNELAGFSTLTLSGLNATTAPSLTVKLDEITIAGPYARVIMNPDQTLNIATLARTEPSAAPNNAAPVPTEATSPTPTAPAPAPTSSPEPKIEIGKIVISDGDYRFTDRSLEPNVAMAINQFGGTISGISSTNLAKADVDLKAMVDGAGPVTIAGKLDALGATKTVDLKVDMKNVDLVPLSPYSGKYAGFELARGKLALDVKVNVDGNKIDSANVVTLNQFTFGNAVKSPEATNLPVRLGVALLKDLDGKIVIDIPVQGSTDDPNFKIGKVVWRVVGNLLTKAAVSPFSLLGAAFGGGGEELAFQDFAPGSQEIQASELKKLQTMVQALQHRPGLSLALEGSYDTAADRYALKRVKLADTVRRAIWEAKRQTDPNIAPPEQLVITPEDNARMLKKLFDEKFPPGTQFGAPVPPAPALVAPPPPPAGLFKRVVNAITLKAAREQRAAQKENERLTAEHQQAVAAAVATGLPIEEMSGRLAETMVIDDNDLRALAQARAQRIRDYFATTGQISPDRLFLAKEKTDTPAPGKGARVFLSLQ